MLFLQERRRNAALAERVKVAEERAEEERQRAARERQRAEQRMEEQHQAMMALIAKVSDAIDRDRNGHSPSQP